MRAVLCLVLALLLSAAVRPANAEVQGPAILNHSLLPPLSAQRLAEYVAFTSSNLPRAFAISADGQIGAQWGAKSIEQARAGALERCAKVGTGCALYAENLDVAWHGRAPEHRMAVPGPLVTGTGYAFVPDERYIWHGPQAARGIYVWSHGKGATDSRGMQPQAHVRWFNNAGFDVVRFDRDVRWDDKDWAAGWLRTALVTLRQSGYRMVVAGGQSRGAWNSLQILDTPGLADVVIAISPAAHGTDVGSVATRQGPELWRIAHGANAPATRVVFVQFKNDPFADDEDERLEKIHDTLFTHVGKGLIIDRPDGFSGHGAGAESVFNLKYGACLLHFALDQVPPSAC